MSLMISIGRWGGLRVQADPKLGFRLVLGWLVLAFYVFDLDSTLGELTTALARRIK